jgi:alpha-glucosidase (family GH31 glycosyl hydrolase)
MILNYITLGGPIEIYTIMRGKVEDILGKYHGMIGYSTMPPFYALGLFQGSSAYNTLDSVK